MLTWNEEHNIAACLASLGAQRTRGFEVILIDAGSSDRTLDVVEAARAGLPFPLRVHVGRPRMPIGEARNLGVQMAQAPLVAFLSADAQLEPHWIDQALTSLAAADMAFGPQVHAPTRWTLGAAVRGLRYQFPQTVPADPLPFASNVAAAYSKRVLQEFPFDPWANAAEDLLLATRATAAGFTATYNPDMVARHRDVSTLRQELRKNVREGEGCGLYVRELGVRWSLLAWSGLLVLALATLLLHVGAGLALLAATLWLPALRRGLRRRGAMPPLQIVAGMAASPPFDLAFLAQYLRGLVGSRRRARNLILQETPT